MAKSYWQEKDYTYYFIYDEPQHTYEEVKAEYSRIRKLIMARAYRLEAAGLGNVADFLRQNTPSLREIGTNKKKLAGALSHAHRNLSERQYSLKGIREFQSRFHEESGERIPIGEVLPFSAYMQSWRLSIYKYEVGSPQATELYPYEYQEIGGSFTDFYTVYKSEVI